VIYSLFTSIKRIRSYSLSHILCYKTAVVCAELRPNAVAFVDSFDLSDFVINSPFGRYDGDVYSHYFDKVTRARKYILLTSPLHVIVAMLCYCGVRTPPPLSLSLIYSHFLFYIADAIGIPFYFESVIKPLLTRKIH
jgi:hypothetical protein